MKGNVRCLLLTVPAQIEVSETHCADFASLSLLDIDGFEPRKIAHGNFEHQSAVNRLSLTVSAWPKCPRLTVLSSAVPILR
jgi:hypothetical protein